MEDQLISFELAKLAKEKGFDESCNFIFEYNKEKYLGFIQRKNSTYDYVITRPTQSLLQRWLREKQEIDVIVFIYFIGNNRKYFPEIYKDNKFQYLDSDLKLVDSYEDALEAGLFEALKL